MNQLPTTAFRLFVISLLLSLSFVGELQAQTPQAQEPPKAAEQKPDAKKAEEDPFALEQAAPLPAGMTGSDVNDPRFKLKPGLYDAEAVAKGMKHVLLLKKPDAFQLGSDDADNPKVQKTLGVLNMGDTSKIPKPFQLVMAQLAFANSDLAFQRKYLFQGNFYGVNIHDISNPAKAKLVTSMVCPGGQGDVSVYKNLMFMSVEMPNGRLDCSTQGFKPEPPPPAGQEQKPTLPAPQKERFRGVRIFDISNIRSPKQVAAVQTCRGSHTHTLVVDPKDKNNVYIHVSGTSFVRQSEELPGCSGETPDKDPNTSLFRIEVIKIPVAAPQNAKVVSSPRVFMDPRTGVLNALSSGGTHGKNGGMEKPTDSDQCHDITVYSSLGLAADPELDDSNSLVRYLLYSADFQTEGIIYASSGFHWKGDGSGKKWSMPNREYFRFGLKLCPCESWRWASGERFIDDAVEIYEKVYRNLRMHDKNYPTPAALKLKIRWGNVEFDGDISKDTPGSDLIKALLLDNQPGPIYLLAWGGQSTIARALKSIQDKYKDTPRWTAIYQKVTRKAILSTSGDQDDTYKSYIQPNWPDIKTLPIGGGGVPLSYGAAARSSAENAIYYSADWTRENISSKGAFGAFYRVWGDGKQMVKNDIFDYFGLTGFTADQLKATGYVVWTPPRPQGSFIAEGDTFTYLNLLDNGLLGYKPEGKDDTIGGWAGNGVTARQGIGQGNGAAARPPTPDPNFTPAAQNGFAARMRWSVTPTFAAANHEPRVTIRGSSRISARPGETVRLQGLASDPDKNAVAVKWGQWKDVDTYPGQVTFSNPNSLATSMQVPTDATAGQTIHLILEATDNGTPALTHYQRVAVSVTR